MQNQNQTSQLNNFEEIILKGKRYKLMPVDDPAVPETALEVTKDILDDYTPDTSQMPGREVVTETLQDNMNVGVAKPKISDYRERYKRKELGLNDVTTRPVPLGKLPQFEDDFGRIEGDARRHSGQDSVFFGPGVTEG